MKKLLSLTLCAVLVCATAFSCISCGKEEKYEIGICQLVQHSALDAATKGFKDAVIAGLGKDNVTFDEQNAQGDSNTCATIINSFVTKNVDLIMANATPALQSAYNATETIPILGTSITEYGVALEINNFNGTVGGNVSGTSDLAPLSEQAQMICDLLPNAQTIGILYCSAEANSAYQVSEMERLLEGSKNVVRYPFTDSNDVSIVTANAVGQVDAIYIPTDNTAASCIETIANIVLPAKVPVIAGEEGICSACGIATLTISYYDLGYKTGEMAVQILKEGKDISTMKIEYAPATKKYNPTVCTDISFDTSVFGTGYQSMGE